jgi:hypothetical protein
MFTITTNGVTKYYIRLWNGVVEPWAPRPKSAAGGEW